MKKINSKRNNGLKKAMLNKKIPRCKSAINLNNCNKNKIIENNNTIDINTIKNENDIDLADKIYKANLLKIKENKLEEKEINILNDKIHEIMIKNYLMEKKINNELNMRSTYEKKQKELAEYINDLNYKFRNYDETVKNYELIKKKLQKENQKLINEYDKKIEEIDSQNNKLKKRLQDRIELYTYQKMQIEEKQAKTKNLEKENNEQEILIKQRVFDNKNKLKEMENKYDALYRKVINLEINLEDKKYLLDNNELYTIKENIDNNAIKKINVKNNVINNDNINNKEIEDINNKIKDYENNNDALIFELTELNKNYENLIMNKRKNKKEKKLNYSFQSTNIRTTTNNSNTYKPKINKK